MHQAETRALRRAAGLLILVSVLRWGWTQREGTPTDAGDTVLPELLAASREAAEEAARRGAPLGDGERLDPNRADEADLDRLPGVGPSTARAIVVAREDGAVFRTAEDLLGVRGIGPATLARMRDFLSFRDPPPRAGPGAAHGLRGVPGLVDLNRADASELERLPGIGPALAERIVTARQEQMFTSLEDLQRVRGVGPATIERLRPHATAGR